MVPLVFGVVILPCILATRYTSAERDNLTDFNNQIFMFLDKGWQDTFFDSNI